MAQLERKWNASRQEKRVIRIVSHCELDDTPSPLLHWCNETPDPSAISAEFFCPDAARLVQ